MRRFWLPFSTDDANVLILWQWLMKCADSEGCSIICGLIPGGHTNVDIPRAVKAEFELVQIVSVDLKGVDPVRWGVCMPHIYVRKARTAGTPH